MLGMANNIDVVSIPQVNNCSLHWLQFSIPACPDDVDTVLERTCTNIFKRSLLEFESSNNSLNGLTSYKTRYDCNGITILADHFNNGGIMVLLNGSACDMIAPDLNLIEQYINFYNGKVSRIDIAVDDFKGLLDISVINRARLDNTVITAFQKARAIDESDLKAGMTSNPTVIFGSNKSDFQIRFYDRAAKEGLNYHWVRCELQLRNDHAGAMLKQIAAGESLATVSMGILQDKLSFRIPAGNNRKNWTEVCSWWSEFLQNTAKLSLGVCKDRHESSMYKKIKWLEKTCAPTLATVRKYYGIGKIEALCDKGDLKLKARRNQEQSNNYKAAA